MKSLLLVLIMTIILGVLMDTLDLYNRCHINIGHWMLFHYITLYLAVIAYRYFYMVLRAWMLYLGSMCLVLFVMLCPVVLILLGLTERKTPKCQPKYLMALNWIFEVISTIVSTFSIVTVIVLLQRQKSRRKREQQLGEALKNMYSELIDTEGQKNPRGIIISLLGEFRDVVDKMPFTQQDFDFLDKNYTEKVTEHILGSEDGAKAVKCMYCRKPFTSTSQELRHPKCGHRFHRECLKDQLRENSLNPVCPECHIPTRSAMLAYAHRHPSQIVRLPNKLDEMEN